MEPVNLTKNINIPIQDVIGFDSRSLFSVPKFDWGKNTSIFRVPIVRQCILTIGKEYILVLGKGSQ